MKPEEWTQLQSEKDRQQRKDQTWSFKNGQRLTAEQMETLFGPGIQDTRMARRVRTGPLDAHGLIKEIKIVTYTYLDPNRTPFVHHRMISNDDGTITEERPSARHV